MIGSQELAEECFTFHFPEIPNHWTFLDEGSYRAAYLGPDGFVYKRNHYPNRRATFGYNHDENRTFTTLTKHGYLWVPKFHLHEVDEGRDDIMVVQFLRDATYSDWSSDQNIRRYSEIGETVADSGEENSGIDPDTGLIYIRDGGNGIFRFAKLKEPA